MNDPKKVLGKYDRTRVKNFLSSFDLDYEDTDYTVYLEENDEIIATGSLKKNIIKCLAVSEDKQGQNLLNTIVSHLIETAFSAGESHLFIYTKPKNKVKLSSLGFYAVYQTEEVLLLENQYNGIENYVKKIKDNSSFPPEKNIGAVILNANPFTLGHEYLIEEALKRCDFLYVFVVEEDLSLFPFQLRFQMIKESLVHYSQIKVVSAGPYLVSLATFPKYFIKDKENIYDVYTDLDIGIFAEKFAKPLFIKTRFVGTEKKDLVTKKYNDTMKTLLPQYGINLTEITRKELYGDVISASAVRRYIADGNTSKVKKYVNGTVYKILYSLENETVIEKIRNYYNDDHGDEI